MIDLHLHTTASDGTLAPRELVARASAAGLTTISVTDHDTAAGLSEARTAAAALGMTFVPGIEITAVEAGRDVHVLGYYFDAESPGLVAFLRLQRADRLRRVREMCDRLDAMGLKVGTEGLLDDTADRAGRSAGRPAIADALVRAGHAHNRDDAFRRLIGRGSPAYVPRRGVRVAEVIELIRRAGGIASLAHPGLVDMDEMIPRLSSEGLAALEARHPDHPADIEMHYRALASRFHLAISGGSDFHGDGSTHALALGRITLDAADFDALAARALRAVDTAR